MCTFICGYSPGYPSSDPSLVLILSCSAADGGGPVPVHQWPHAAGFVVGRPFFTDPRGTVSGDPGTSAEGESSSGPELSGADSAQTGPGPVLGSGSE